VRPCSPQWRRRRVRGSQLFFVVQQVKCLCPGCKKPCALVKCIAIHTDRFSKKKKKKKKKIMEFKKTKKIKKKKNNKKKKTEEGM
jgi:hypothetical protein